MACSYERKDGVDSPKDAEFLMKGSQIHHKEEEGVVGEFNVDGTITWYEGTDVYTIWSRPGNS